MKKGARRVFSSKRKNTESHEMFLQNKYTNERGVERDSSTRGQVRKEHDDTGG